MKLTVAITVALSMLATQSLDADEVSATLSDDATTLTTKGIQWTSAIMDLKLRDGSKTKMRLELEFTPIHQGALIDTRHAKVKLRLSTPTAGIEGLFSVSTSIGSSPKDVHLQQQGDVRTMTVKRSMDEFPDLDVTSPRYRKTQRHFDRTAMTFSYELKGDTLILKGFPETPIVWGSSEFTSPERDIVFKLAQVK